MGDFLGHGTTGVIMWFFAVWWATNIFHDYFGSLRPSASSESRYAARPYYLGPIVRYPIESLMKLAFAVTEITGEWMMGRENGHFREQESPQHIVMKFAVGISGAMDLILHHNKVGHVLNEKLLQPVGGLITICTAIFVFHFHQPAGQSQLDSLLHHLNVLNLMALAGCVLLEVWNVNRISCSLARVISMLTFGSWLTHVGFILYPRFFGTPFWNSNDSHELQLVILLYLLHWLGNLAVVFVIAISTKTRMKTPFFENPTNPIEKL